MTDDIAVHPESATAAGVSAIGAESTHEFIRYFIASALALALDMGALWFLTSVLKISYLISGALAFTLGLIVVYILSIIWVFNVRNVRSPLVEFGAFALIGLVGLALNELVLWIFTGLFGVFYLLSKLVSVVIVFSWNFSARKWLLFSTNS